VGIAPKRAEGALKLDTESLTAIGLALQFLALAGTLYAFYQQLKAQRLALRENTKVQLSQGYYNAILLGQRPLEMLIEDDNLARIVEVGYDQPEALTAVEGTIFGNFMFLQFNAWEFFYYQHRDGQIRKELWVGAENYYRWLIDTRRGLSRFWVEWSVAYDEPFRSYVTRQFGSSATDSN
jgi:hypothetical protein